MASEIEGLNRWEWRRKDDGTPQRRVKERIDATYGSLDLRDPVEAQLEQTRRELGE